MATVNLTPEARQIVAISAAASVGAGDPNSVHSVEEQVRQRIVELTVAALNANNPDSRIAKTIDQIQECHVFPAILLGGSKDENTGRTIVRIKADNPGQQADADGNETINTERTFIPEGAAMTALARSLVGHRVLVFKQVEVFTSGGQTKKGKVLRHLVDLGMPQEAGAA